MNSLNIPNPKAIDLGEAFGISQQRMNEISVGLDDMVKKASTGEIRLIYTVDIFNYIRSLCNTDEEYTWAIHNHIMWLARTGRLFTTHEAQQAGIKQFGNPQRL